MEQKHFKVNTRLIRQQIKKVMPLGILTQNFAETVANRHNAKVTDLCFKSYDSILRKCETRKCQVSSLRDLARTTIVCDYNDIPNVIRDLIDTLKANNCFGRYVQQEYESRGYWGNIINPVFYSDGKMFMTEIQVTSYEMFYASHASDFCSAFLGNSLYDSIKNATGVEGGKGHLYYEISRDKSGAYTLEQKMQAERDNYNYYNNFWGNYKFGETKFINN